MTLERKFASLSIWFFNSWHKRVNPLTGTPTHTCNFWDFVSCVPMILVDFFPNFFGILVGTTCWRAPRMRMIFNAHFSSFELRKPLENLWTAQCFLLKDLSKHFMCFCGCFSETEKNLRQIRCSVRSCITVSWEELDNTWENWQHKPVQPSMATSACLLTREGCIYTHLAGEHLTTIRKSSPKPVRFFGVRLHIRGLSQK